MVPELPKLRPRGRPKARSLSTRKIAVLEAVYLGRRNKEIAFHLHLSEQTVKKHVSQLLDHCAVPSRAGLIRAALAAGDLRPR